MTRRWGLPHLTAVLGPDITSLFSGLLLAEVNGTLSRLAAMQPTPGSAEPAGAPDAFADGDRGSELAIQTPIAGLEAQLTRGR